VQAERLAPFGQTIAALSHHIKNIMQGSASAPTWSALAPAARPGAIAKGLALVDKNQDEIDDLILDMLSYRRNANAQEPTDLMR